MLMGRPALGFSSSQARKPQRRNTIAQWAVAEANLNRWATKGSPLCSDCDDVLMSSDESETESGSSHSSDADAQSKPVPSEPRDRRKTLPPKFPPVPPAQRQDSGGLWAVFGKLSAPWEDSAERRPSPTVRKFKSWIWSESGGETGDESDHQTRRWATTPTSKVQRPSSTQRRGDESDHQTRRWATAPTCKVRSPSSTQRRETATRKGVDHTSGRWATTPTRRVSDQQLNNRRARSAHKDSDHPSDRWATAPAMVKV